MPAQSYGLPSLSDLSKLFQATHSPTGGGVGTQQVTSYSLGPISAGADSILGGFLSFLQGGSQAYGSGAAAVGAGPVGQAINLGATNAAEISSGIAQSNAAWSKANPGASPIDFLTHAASNVGKLAGYTLGGIAQVGGAALGNEATSAAPGVGAGVGSVATGTVNLGVTAAGSGLLGAITGAGAGLGNLTGATGASAAGGTSNLKTYLLIGGGLLLLFVLDRKSVV